MSISAGSGPPYFLVIISMSQHFLFPAMLNYILAKLFECVKNKIEIERAHEAFEAQRKASEFIETHSFQLHFMLLFLFA